MVFMLLFLFQEGVHVLSPEEQYKWLKTKEEACSFAISSSPSTPTGEPNRPITSQRFSSEPSLAQLHTSFALIGVS
jgi:hypothetical protein